MKGRKKREERTILAYKSKGKEDAPRARLCVTKDEEEETCKDFGRKLPPKT